MNTELQDVASRVALAAPDARELSLSFGLACAKRVEHRIEEQEVVMLLGVLEQYVSGQVGEGSLRVCTSSVAAASKCEPLRLLRRLTRA